MEFPQLGEQCSWSQCKNLDFLPFTCSHCRRIFCKNHFNPNSHECDQFKKDPVSDQPAVKSFICTAQDCTNSEPLEMLCPKCARHFCLSHRYHDCFDVDPDIEKKKILWNEPREKFAESIKTVEKTVNENIRKAMLNPKKAATAMKVQLMKLKGKAVGSPAVPTTDRLYFLIHHHQSHKKEPKPVFVSQDWSLGKVIDAVSTLCNVPNRNNETNAPKLRLFKLDGSQLSPDKSTRMCQLVQSDRIINGESLILEYVSPEYDTPDYVLKECLQYCNS